MNRFRSILPLLIGLVTFAIFVLYGFGGAFPPGLNHDAAWHGLYAFRILNGEPWTIYTPESFGHETPYNYFMALVFRLFGASKEAIEATATVFGFLSVALFFWVMKKRTQNAYLALGLSLLWISSSALVLYSRVGWRLVTLIPAALLVAAACRFYLDDAPRHRLWAALIGFSAGITLYTYNGGRAILLFVPLFWAARWLQVRFFHKSGEFSARSTWQDASISLGVWLLVSAPMLHFALGNWQIWMGRAASLTGEGGGLAPKLANIVASLGYFNFSARGDDFFTNFPVLEGPMALLWLAGIIFAIFRFRNYWPELLLFLIFLLPGIATKPSFHRAVGTLPLVYLFGCYFLIAGWRRTRQTRAVPLFSVALGVLIALQIGTGWKKLYLDKQPFLWGFYPETTVVGRYLHAHPDRKFVLYAGNWPQDALTFLATTNSARPGENFVHYQGYNTPSGDGLPEIIRDLESGVIARPAHFIVDVAKTEAFVRALAPNSAVEYAVQGQGELERDGRPVARFFRVN